MRELPQFKQPRNAKNPLNQQRRELSIFEFKINNSARCACFCRSRDLEDDISLKLRDAIRICKLKK